jgi:hypothetical protein
MSRKDMPTPAQRCGNEWRMQSLRSVRSSQLMLARQQQALLM